MAKAPAPDVLRIAVAQLNPTVGDVAGNLAKAREARADAARQGADLVLFTELFIAGYPPEDLVLKPAFLAACERAVRDIAEDTADGGPGVIVGTPLKRKSGTHNSIIFADGGKILAERYKLDLPNYGEFDEKRVFQAGPEMPGTGELPRHPARHSDLRGHLGRCRCLRNASRKRGRNPAGAQRLALLSRQGRRPPSDRHPAGHRMRPADHLCQPTRRSGRTGLRRRLLCDRRRQVARLPDEPVRRDGRGHDVEKERRGLDLRRRADVEDPGKGRGRLPRLHVRPARLRQQERLQERRARTVWRHRFGDLRSACGRCAGRGAFARHHDALSLHLEGFARRTPRIAPARSAADTTSCRSSSRSTDFRMR